MTSFAKASTNHRAGGTAPSDSPHMCISEYAQGEHMQPDGVLVLHNNHPTS